jgi:hypothetical protein
MQMRTAVALVLLALVVVTLISGCTQPEGPTGELTEKQMEEQAYQQIDQEIEDALSGMALEELENELLGQG